MRSVGIKVLKNKLSEYVRAAQAGETVLVTDRDQVVAQLMPPHRMPTSDEDFVAMGVREGWLTPAQIHHTVPVAEPGPRHPDERIVTFEQLMADLAGDREDR